MKTTNLPEIGKVFRIGKDHTLLKMEEYDGYRQGMRPMIYFRVERIWHYADSFNMSAIIFNDIERLGFEYVSDELVEE
ncbi:hypothetical protein [Pseudolactococcus reticulitermitis]|uniref:Uncharacterized protein n=1 Tax=Pseudolactococcus reticulitermitis TaxID=2025039 RepID=A0A224XCD5_9LACT|nr:hypothetical protein [Lactococcus reticulitermitis]GAX47293.1 hypothetical protein RsY01_892 [Lactococcus reticulitermitis]